MSPDAILALITPNPNKNTLISNAVSLGYSGNRLAIPDQVHSAQVTWIDSPGNYPDTDGLITANPHVTLTLKVADCVPVYLSEPQKKIIGLIHAGWKGIVAGIVPNALQLLQKKGVNVEEIRWYLGPAIGICCYEVGGEVAKHFDSEAKMQLDGGKWKVGLHEQIRIQMSAAGVSEENITSSNICTFETVECHSYRRDGSKAGRMFASLRLKN